MRSLTEIQRDMNDYLPRYYGDIPVATNIIDREATEAAQLNADAYDVLAQMYVDTATWGLARWERIFGITPDELKPIDQRRSVIKSKVRGVGTVTPAMIKSIAEAYANGEVEVTESGTNMLPPFNSGWTLHENTRMKQANFVGKVAGSTVANPHDFKVSTAVGLQTPVTGNWVDAVQGDFTAIETLNAAVKSNSIVVSTRQSQHVFYFDLIEHVIRTYGVGVFGSAVTTAERVAWLKANVSKLNANWHGYGSGPAGNMAYFRIWNGTTWAGSNSHSSGTVTKSSILTTLLTTYLMSDGFVYFLTYSDASNGTIASTINTDFVELEVYMAAGSIPQAENVLTLNATTGNQNSSCIVPVNTFTQYALSIALNSGAKVRIDALDAAQAFISMVRDYSTSFPHTFTTPANTRYLQFYFSNTSSGAGVFTFTNPQLERGATATPFENLPAYTVGIKFVSTLGVPANLADLETIVRETLPAHLAVSYVFTYKTFGELAGYGVTYGAIETAGLTFGAIETWEGP